MPAADGQARLDEFDRHRPALFALAYRMLGSVMDAEDIVQEAFLRWQHAAPEQVGSPKAYLLKIAVRLSIDVLRAARTRREVYVGPWLPEPLVRAEAPDPSASVEAADSLSFAILLLLERLTPLERAVFILHDVFGYTFDEVAQMLGTNAAHCRQLGHRARERVAAGRQRFTATPAQAEQAARQFIRACAAGDMQGLLALLAEDITLWSDGGGKVQAARNPISGADRVARFLLGVQRKAPASRCYEVALVNGRPGIVARLAGQVYHVYGFDVGPSGQIRAIYSVLNPDKLRAIGAG
jgi:RNA polymerase sigma-70 factor (ECF subfamily)